VSASLSSDGPFGLFADRLLTLELPDLPPTARLETVEFVCRRARQIPTPLRLGLLVLSSAMGVAQRLLGLDRASGFVRGSTLPFVGELPRMVRSLGFAYIWETWPETSPTGAQA
jgi:hypothetical protein